MSSIDKLSPESFKEAKPKAKTANWVPCVLIDGYGPAGGGDGCVFLLDGEPVPKTTQEAIEATKKTFQYFADHADRMSPEERKTNLTRYAEFLQKRRGGGVVPGGTHRRFWIKEINGINHLFTNDKSAYEDPNVFPGSVKDYNFETLIAQSVAESNHVPFSGKTVHLTSEFFKGEEPEVSFDLVMSELKDNEGLDNKKVTEGKVIELTQSHLRNNRGIHWEILCGGICTAKDEKTTTWDDWGVRALERKSFVTFIPYTIVIQEEVTDRNRNSTCFFREE